MSLEFLSTSEIFCHVVRHRISFQKILKQINWFWHFEFLPTKNCLEDRQTYFGAPSTLRVSNCYDKMSTLSEKSSVTNFKFFIFKSGFRNKVVEDWIMERLQYIAENFCRVILSIIMFLSLQGWNNENNNDTFTLHVFFLMSAVHLASVNCLFRVFILQNLEL